MLMAQMAIEQMADSLLQKRLSYYSYQFCKNVVEQEVEKKAQHHCLRLLGCCFLSAVTS
jgi:hypothetical protein